MADNPPSGTPMAEHLAEIAARLREIEEEKQRERSKPEESENCGIFW